MKATYLLCLAAACPLWAGCLVPQTQLTAVQTQNHVLTLQNQAQLAEIGASNIMRPTSRTSWAAPNAEFAQLQEQAAIGTATG